jgi:hypothetical protein
MGIKTETRRKSKERKQDLSFSASAMAFRHRRGVEPQRTTDLPTSTLLTATSLFWNILHHFVLVSDDL